MKRVYNVILGTIAIVAIVALGYYLYVLANESPWRISAAEARRRLRVGEVDLVLDVRTSAERRVLGYYPSSVHVPSSDLDRVMLERYPDKNMAILVYCNSGQRARLATDKLHQLGYKNARYISSGHKSLLE
jgi:rhodanese-related sulfurtransferase